ncbi:MAG: hypothetical protein KGI06_06385, partial [Candidatus Micrarchaeota archaeon]|nr:hypothetical protein [Candidatus Micrarchaeota archaeon]
MDTPIVPNGDTACLSGDRGRGTGGIHPKDTKLGRGRGDTTNQKICTGVNGIEGTILQCPVVNSCYRSC